MFSILDGRESFYQWDLDRKVVVKDSSIREVHFCNKTDDCSLVVETYQENGLTLANVPNILLQTAWKIRVFGYTGDFTKYEQCFKVIARTKPSDYVYTETEVKNYDELLDRIEKLEKSGGSGGGITQEELEETLENYPNYDEAWEIAYEAIGEQGVITYESFYTELEYAITTPYEEGGMSEAVAETVINSQEYNEDFLSRFYSEFEWAITHNNEDGGYIDIIAENIKNYLKIYDGGVR